MKLTIIDKATFKYCYQNIINNSQLSDNHFQNYFIYFNKILTYPRDTIIEASM